jgi:type IV pilus assembly protein PilQ
MSTAFTSQAPLNISIKKPELLRVQHSKKKFTGEDQEFQDVEIHSVLDISRSSTGYERCCLVISVAGNITLRLINAPWDQAPDINLTSKKLRQTRMAMLS